jgi:hypothetical protein
MFVRNESAALCSGQGGRSGNPRHRRLNNLFGSPEDLAQKIRSSLAQERITANIGVAGNPDTAATARAVLKASSS